ncbi:MAG: polysaccharide deacetylase family protein [Candidatus Saccharimonadales bacterium]
MAQKRTKQKSARTPRWLVVFTIIFVAVIGLGLLGWAGWEVWQARDLKSAQETISSKYKNIQYDSETFQDEFLQAHATYVQTENDAINKDVKGEVDSRFLPCKAAGEHNRSSVTYECHASPEIDFATDDYLQVTYNFREYTGGDPSDVKVRQVGLLYDRKAGKRLHISDLFKPDSGYLQKLSNMSRDALHKKFDKSYYDNGAYKDAMEQGTVPQDGNFDDFLLSDQALTVIFEPGDVAPVAEGVVTVDLSTDQLYDLFTQAIIDEFLTNLKAQREAEKKQAEAAAAARHNSQNQVGANRENIDCKKMKCIAITYDDGPDTPEGTKLLDALKARNAVTTFCMVGNRVAANAAELKRVVDEKNEICNHSWDHSDLTKLSDSDIKSQIDRTNQAIFGASGLYPKLMRPPYGAVNDHVISQINMPLAMWSVDTRDWKDRNPDIVYQRAIAGAKPGAIILMHEIHDTTIQAAPRIIDELQRQGYILVTVSELFGITKDNIGDFTNKKLFHN